MIRPLPPLYPITDASSPEPLAAQVARYGNAGYSLVQFRGKSLDAKEQWEQLRQALIASHENGGWPLICINDRADLAMLAGAEGLRPWGLHLGQGDLPPAEAAALPHLDALRFGSSTHGPEEWSAITGPVDHAGLGPFRATNSKPDHGAPIGLDGLASGCEVLRAKGIAPIAIGGLTLADAEACFGAGAECLAMIGEVQRSTDPSALGWAVQRARLHARPFHLHRGVVLAGSSGAGKSTVGAQLSERLKLPFHDLDEVVTRAERRSIPELFERDGEAAFRALECHHLQPFLNQPAVIALGGGAWETGAIRSAVRASGFQVLWLAESPSVCWSRVELDPTRPLARDRNAFMSRHRIRLGRWCELPSLSAFGHPPADLVTALVP